MLPRPSGDAATSPALELMSTSEPMWRPQEALTAPGVCTNYSHKDTLVTAVPLSKIKRSTEWLRWRRIYHLLSEGYDPYILIYAHTSL